MRKSTIWILAAIMAFAFFSLLYLQIMYLRESIKQKEEQFNEIVTRSLKDVSRKLQEEETEEYLTEKLLENQKKQAAAYQREMAQRNQTNESAILYQERIKVTTDDNQFNLQYDASTIQTKPRNQIFQAPNKGGSKSISKIISDMQEDEKRRFLNQLEIVYDVTSDIINTASDKPIEERVNLKELGANIKNAIRYNANGLELPFEYEVVDKNNKPIYPKDGVGWKYKQEDFNATLFPNDPNDKTVYIKLYFPTKQDYLISETLFIYPSIGFTFILLVTFIIVIYIIFRQKRLSEMKSDFMNNMTHELKTPVSTISLAAQMLKDGSITKSPEVFKHISGVINDETERLSFQVEKVLQMSLFERQKATLKMKELDINDIVVTVANTFQIKVEKFGGNLDIDLNATESVINADKMHITNVLFNLLDNAVKYRREDIPLELMIRTWNNNSNNKLYISVEDNGIGIKKDAAKRIFDRFYRASTGNRHDVKGFGLGLAYVKKIIDDHKGTIKAESELGKGSKFIICLPILRTNE